MNKEDLEKLYSNLVSKKQQQTDISSQIKQKENAFKKELENFFEIQALPDFINAKHLYIQSIWNYAINTNVEPKWFFGQILQALRHIEQTDYTAENTYNFDETGEKIILPGDYSLQSFDPTINYLMAIRYLKWQVVCESHGRRDANFDTDAEKLFRKAKEILQAMDRTDQGFVVQSQIKTYAWMESHSETLVSAFFEN